MSITSIKENFKKVIAYSQNIKTPQVDILFDKWFEAKRNIIEAWQGKFIYEVPETVYFELSEAEKKNRLSEFINAVDEMYDNTNLVDFLDWLNIEEVFKNHLTRDYWLDDEKKISKGTKVVKAFKYFEDDERVLRNLQDQLSMIIQEDKISGQLCFSVHPLDFLSASENTYHWRSCHALDGDYRAGNLSYMMDSSTIMCYLRKPKEEVNLPNFPQDVKWNSKKWRMLLFLEEDWHAMFAGRQYPFFSPSALDIVQRELIASLNLTWKFWTPWYNDFLSEFPRSGQQVHYNDSYFNDRVVALGGNPYKMKNLVHDCAKPLHFNDLLHSSCYVPYYCWNRFRADTLQFNIGGAVPCPCCNGKHIITRSHSMMCDECEAELGEGENSYFAYCGCCERRVPRDTMGYVRGLEDYVCPECFEREMKQCECCRDYWYTCDITYNHDRKEYLCPSCQNYYKLNPNGKGPITLDWPFDEGLPF